MTSVSSSRESSRDNSRSRAMESMREATRASQVSRGTRSAAVRDLQESLKAKGISPGPIDGIFGPKTERAVRSFQQANGLKVDGIAGPQTWGALKSANASAAAAAVPSAFEPPPPAAGANGFARITRTTNAGKRNQMVSGTITVNGRTYNFRSGGHGRGSLPQGSYTVTAHMHSRNTKGMVVDGVGYSFALNDKYDPRVGATRSALRIHPDGGSAGTQGCIGIVGDGNVQRQFRSDMEAELRRNGGRYTLTVR